MLVYHHVYYMWQQMRPLFVLRSFMQPAYYHHCNCDHFLLADLVFVC